MWGCSQATKHYTGRSWLVILELSIVYPQSKHETEIKWSSCNRKTACVQQCRLLLEMCLQSWAQCGLFPAITDICFQQGDKSRLGCVHEKKWEVQGEGRTEGGWYHGCGVGRQLWHAPKAFQRVLPLHLWQSQGKLWENVSQDELQNLPMKVDLCTL